MTTCARQRQRAVSSAESVKMKQLLLPLAAVVLVPLCCGDYTQFCHGQPCPEYTVVETNETFEKRNYVATTWISTEMKSTNLAEIFQASGRLRDFWNKQKEAGIEIPDSWPFLITQSKVGDADVLSLSWFLPPGFEPQISNTSVTLEHRDAATVYVRSYSGMPSDSAGQENGKFLKDALTKAGINFDLQTCPGAFYESFLCFTHHNEIWLYGSEQ